MKKLILLCILVLSMIGCSALQTTPGDTYQIDSVKGKVLTSNYLVYEKDFVTLEENYHATSIVIKNSILGNSQRLEFDLYYYPKEKELYAFFPLYSGHILKEVIISNGIDVLSLKITNFSNFGSNKNPHTFLSKEKAVLLEKILKSPAPIIMRAIHNDEIYDLTFADKYRSGMLELLEVYFGKKIYNIDFSLKG